MMGGLKCILKQNKGTNCQAKAILWSTAEEYDRGSRAQNNVSLYEGMPPTGLNGRHDSSTGTPSVCMKLFWNANTINT